MKVTAYNFAAIVTNAKAGFAGITTLTELKHNKFAKGDRTRSWDVLVGKPVYVWAKRTVHLAISYENTVNNQRKREDLIADFSSSELPWGSFWNGSKTVIEHKNELYLRYYPGMTSGEDKTELQWEDGTPLTESEIALVNEFTTEKSSSSRQGVEKEIQVRSITMKNILRARVDGIEYDIIK